MNIYIYMYKYLYIYIYIYVPGCIFQVTSGTLQSKGQNISKTMSKGQINSKGLKP